MKFHSESIRWTSHERRLCKRTAHRAVAPRSSARPPRPMVDFGVVEQGEAATRTVTLDRAINLAGVEMSVEPFDVPEGVSVTEEFTGASHGHRSTRHIAITLNATSVPHGVYNNALKLLVSEGVSAEEIVIPLRAIVVPQISPKEKDVN